MMLLSVENKCWALSSAIYLLVPMCLMMNAMMTWSLTENFSNFDGVGKFSLRHFKHFELDRSPSISKKSKADSFNASHFMRDEPLLLVENSELFNIEKNSEMKTTQRSVFNTTLYLLPFFRINETKKTIRTCKRWTKDMLERAMGPAFNARYMSITRPLSHERYDRNVQSSDLKTNMAQDQVVIKDVQTELPFSAKPGHIRIKSKFLRLPNYYSDVSFNRLKRNTRHLMKRGQVKQHTNINQNFSTNQNESRPDLRIKHKTEHIDSDKLRRNARSRVNSTSTDFMSSMPWKCDYEVRWIDLGPDHFPRYLRTAECTSKTCWYTHMACKPRAFTVHVLKRWSDKCIPTISTDSNFSFPNYGNSNEYDGGKSQIIDPKLPFELQEKWVWVEIGVTFCCECAF